MLSPGDGIAIAGVCGVALGALAKFKVAPKNGNGKYVTKGVCDANVAAMIREMEHIRKELDDLNKYLRNGRK